MLPLYALHHALVLPKRIYIPFDTGELTLETVELLALSV